MFKFPGKKELPVNEDLCVRNCTGNESTSEQLPDKSFFQLTPLSISFYEVNFSAIFSNNLNSPISLHISKSKFFSGLLFH